MHQQAWDFAAFAAAHAPRGDRLRVLEIGSGDVNGSCRGLFPAAAEYVGCDVAAGPGVDVVCAAEDLRFPDASFDVVFSTETLEHDETYADTLRTAVRLARPGGLVFFTCATTGRAEHGTRRTAPEACLAVGDYYRNLTESDVRAAIDVDACFSEHAFAACARSCDLYFVGFRAGGGPGEPIAPYVPVRVVARTCAASLASGDRPAPAAGRSARQVDCIADLVRHFGGHIRVLRDGGDGNSACFLGALRYALAEYDDDDVVYFVEDDYLHAPGALAALRAAFAAGGPPAEYATLYDHPDKYTGSPPPARLWVAAGGGHWREAPSTTCTFAARVRTVRRDMPLFEFFARLDPAQPADREMWGALRGLGRVLVSRVPGLSTHAMTGLESPGWALEREE
jgi:SAM-dependent methyltransferase